MKPVVQSCVFGEEAGVFGEKVTITTVTIMTTTAVGMALLGKLSLDIDGTTLKNNGG